ncbi:MAG TPA: septation regulator SpoVG [Eubacteriales bacterium]|nr:septation regulator SpoVG [Clostridia bacterium]HRR89210.1 septation regulator SpoVG [Eubacteriales bacterium]HRU84705.1 septation regulator SpoVG [Eubacteriales bacterium]
MNITNVLVRLVKRDEGKLKAVASITIDECFVVHDIKIIAGNEGDFIAMPSKRVNDGTYRDIAHPINSDTREFIRKHVIEEYERVLAEEGEG